MTERLRDRAAVGAALVVGVVLAAGCKQEISGLTVEGRVVEDGMPVAVRPNEETFVVLAGTGAEGKLGFSFPAKAAADGTFTLTGPVGKGVPAGSYSVAVYTNAQNPARPEAAPTDRLKGAFKTESTPLKCEVSATTAEVVVDLTKKSVQ
jgi:hypothetical protein